MSRALRRALIAVVVVCGSFLAVYLSAAARVGMAVPKPAARPAGAAPRLVVAEPQHDFGEITQGMTVKHVFVVRNEGPGPARVERTSTSCGCTATLLSREEIPPGGEARLETTFSSGRMKGAFRKTVTVYSDAVDSPLRLTIQGSIRPLLTVEPERVDFHDVPLGRPFKQRVVLRPTSPDVVLRPSLPTSQIGAVTATGLRAEGAGAWSFVVMARPTREGERLFGQVPVETGLQQVPSVVVRFTGRGVR